VQREQTIKAGTNSTSFKIFQQFLLNLTAVQFQLHRKFWTTVPLLISPFSGTTNSLFISKNYLDQPLQDSPTKKNMVITFFPGATVAWPLLISTHSLVVTRVAACN